MKAPYFDQGRMTSANFEPKRGADGLSVSRQSVTTRAMLVSLVPEGVEFGIAELTVAEVRECGIDVVKDATDQDPGHALIVPATALNSQALRRKLRKAARFVPPSEIIGARRRR